ncbi:MAG: RNA 2',3'-cyclic phosphodiesterase [Alphaproteobacteria bacterium]|nr:RNA 2',3'-cyclic phosphodiesterase [Alphaproteobacteria bacterium]MDE2629743.1 RNA 2',3'-cyclic phosphodiesterase [Alphaproteobacteria bacterium]
MRLFVAIALPDAVAQSLALLQAGVPGARWQTRDQLHLTLRFIGEVDGRDAAAIDDALATISVPAFSVELKGVGSFGGKHPHALWAGVAANDALLHLQRKIESALQRIGLEADGRKYKPHVSLAKLKGTQNGHVMDFLTDHALYASGPFAADGFILYSSLLTPNGSIYRAEKAYRLK